MRAALKTAPLSFCTGGCMNEKRFSGEVSRLRAPERVERLEVARVVNLSLEGGSFRNVLDVGTGSGLFAEAFAGHGLSAAGVDANPEMIAAVQAYVPAGQFREAPAEALPYPDEAFDLVFMGLLLHESDEPLQAVREARRVTRHRVSILEWPYQDGSFGPPLAHRISPAVLTELVQQAGFSKWETLPLAHLILYRLTC
jgi:ubiquinone/menaquinone biosynthesis C-methylase UbiE